MTAAGHKAFLCTGRAYSFVPESDEKRACEELAPYYDYVRHDDGFAGGTVEYVLKGFSKGVTEDMFHDGIYLGLKKIGLIGR